MRLDRLLAITIMLLNRDRITAKELSKYFEVSVRTIYRDIDAINMAGIPIVSHQGTAGGFGIVDNYKLDRQLLTFDNMLSMITALKGVNTTFEDKELDAAIEKITSLVPGDKEALLKKHTDQFVVDFLPWGYRNKHKVLLKSLYSAINDCRVIEFTYKNMKSEVVKRVVEPMTLIFKGVSWYLFAYCRLKSDYRFFKLARIRSFSRLDTTFTKRDKSYQEFNYFNNEAVTYTNMVLKFSPRVRVRVEDYYEDDEITVEHDGSLMVHTAVPEDEWIYSYLLGYGEDLEVVSPSHIRQLLYEKAKKIINIYKPDIPLSHE